jgi:hypothetical protein
VVATRDPRDPNRDLWWGCAGGGGGNFGVVTRFWLRSRDARGDDPADLLPPSPSEALVVEASWPWSQIDEARFSALLTAYGAWHEAHSDADSPYADLGHWLFLNHASAGGIFLASQIDATVPRAERLIDDFVNYLSAALGVEPDFRNDLRAPFLKATQYSTLGGAVLTNPNFRSEHKSAFMRASFPRRQIEVAYRHLTRTDYENPYGQLVLTSVGGQINRMPSDVTASPHRDALLLLLYQNHWTAAAEDGVNVAWLREFFAEMYADTGGVPVPNAVTDGSYINYPDRDLSDPAHNRSGVPWHAFYYKGNYPRLQRVKARWDPGNVFRHRQSIQL